MVLTSVNLSKYCRFETLNLQKLIELDFEDTWTQLYLWRQQKSENIKTRVDTSNKSSC